MKSYSLALAYHGCDDSLAREIVLGRRDIQISRNDYDWLGGGAYFWENDSRRALDWANSVRDYPQHFGQKVANPGVIGAVIDPGNCLDLTDAESLSVVCSAYHEFEELMQNEKIPMPQNERSHHADIDLVKRYLDCAVLNFLHEYRKQLGLPAFDCVRAAFVEGQPLFPNSKIMEKTHIQICVRDPRKSIVGYFLPRE